MPPGFAIGTSFPVREDDRVVTEPSGLAADLLVLRRALVQAPVGQEHEQLPDPALRRARARPGWPRVSRGWGLPCR